MTAWQTNRQRCTYEVVSLSVAPLPMVTLNVIRVSLPVKITEQRRVQNNANENGNVNKVMDKIPLSKKRDKLSKMRAENHFIRHSTEISLCCLKSLFRWMDETKAFFCKLELQVLHKGMKSTWWSWKLRCFNVNENDNGTAPVFQSNQTTIMVTLRKIMGTGTETGFQGNAHLWVT